MAFGDGIIDAYMKGQQIGQVRRENARKQAINQALSKGFIPGNPEQAPATPFDDEGNPNPMVAGTAPSMNFGNSIAELYKSGYGTDALALEQAKDQNDLAKMFKIAQIQNMGTEAPKTRQVPFGEGMVRTEEWNPQKRSWSLVAEGKKPSLVNIDNKAEGAGLKKLSEQEAELVSELKKNAIGGSKLLGPLNRMEQLNNSGNVADGPMANFNQELGKFAIYLGAGDDVKKRVAAGEQYFAAAADAVRDKIKALGAGSAVSNVDLLFTRQSVGDLTNTKGGRALIIKAMKADIDNINRLSKASDSHFRGVGKGSLSGFDPTKHVQILPEVQGEQPEVTAVNPQTGERLILRNGQWVKN